MKLILALGFQRGDRDNRDLSTTELTMYWMDDRLPPQRVKVDHLYLVEILENALENCLPEEEGYWRHTIEEMKQLFIRRAVPIVPPSPMERE